MRAHNIQKIKTFQNVFKLCATMHTSALFDWISHMIGETAFTHDPSYKPPHAVVDKWYRTEAGPKTSLAGRVEESRWQSCHSMQSGREPRKPTRSRLPADQKKAGPGPTSYHMRDPWEVRVRQPQAWVCVRFCRYCTLPGVRQRRGDPLDMSVCSKSTVERLTEDGPR